VDEGTFELVLIVVVTVAAVVAIVSIFGLGDLYRSIGKGGLSLDEPDRPPAPPPESPQARAEAEAEIRQMVEAKSALREARGEQPLDVEAEVAELTGKRGSAQHDEALREEVRQLVEASNERRRRRGEEPLEVEAEVERQLREFG
jgi:hypothetical protein